MKLAFTLLFSLCFFSSQAQWYWQENFEAPYDGYRDHFIFDSSHQNNLWQIGRPVKSIFSSAYSTPNVIITDTLNAYPANDTSVFIIKHAYMSAPMLSLNFRYQLSIDSGTFVKVEVSGDSGLNWIDPITEDTTYMFNWGFTKPRLDTSVLNWQQFQLNMYPWSNAVAGGPYVFPHYRTSDTILFRFTFISDSDTTSKDGWMMDNFVLQNAIMEGGIHMLENDKLISVYPIPSKGPLCIYSTATTPAAITIYDVKGQEVYATTSNDLKTMLNLTLAPGMYYLKCSTGKEYALKRIIIN